MRVPENRKSAKREGEFGPLAAPAAAPAPGPSPDAPAEGVLMAGLTNDAVAAFLRDHAPATDEAPDAIVPTTSYDHAANLDVMQGVLA